MCSGPPLAQNGIMRLIVILDRTAISNSRSLEDAFGQDFAWDSDGVCGLT